MGKVTTVFAFLGALMFIGVTGHSAYEDMRRAERAARAAEQDRDEARTRRREEHEAKRATYRLFREIEEERRAYLAHQGWADAPGRARSVVCTLDLEHIDPVWACYVDVAHRERNEDFVCRRVRGRMHCIQDRGYLPGQEPADFGH